MKNKSVTFLRAFQAGQERRKEMNKLNCLKNRSLSLIYLHYIFILKTGEKGGLENMQNKSVTFLL